MESDELKDIREVEISHNAVDIATSVSCRAWYDGPLKSPKDIDKIRGDLSIQMLTRAKGEGYNTSVVVDAGSNDFVSELQKKGITTYQETEKSLSGSRRQAIELGSNKDQVKIIMTTEPEKISMMDFVDQLCKPIINGEADIVIPRREKSSFDSYPPEQKERELEANRIANTALRQTGLLKEDDEDIDFWVGVRLFKNTPDIVSLFSTKTHYELSADTQRVIDEKSNSSQDEKIDLRNFDTDIWANALYIPIIRALHKGFRIKNVNVPYLHPEVQTQSETGDPSFDKKRVLQLKNIILAMVQEIKRLEDNNSSTGIKIVND